MGALSALIFGKPKRTSLKSKDGKSDILLVDVTTKITPDYAVEVTDFPVESGPDVSDNARVQPLKITVTGEFSETPLNLAAELSGLTTAVGGAIGTAIGGFGSTLGAVGGGLLGASLFSQSAKASDGNTYKNPASAGRAILESMAVKRTMFTLVDQYKSYPNMIMTSLSFPSDQKTGHKLQFTFTAKQLTIISAQTVEIQKIKKENAHTAAPKQKLGVQGTEPNNSILTNLKNWAHGG